MKKNDGAYLLGGLFLVFGLATLVKKTAPIVVTKITKKLMGNKIDTLHPKIKPYVVAFLNKALAAGIDLRITDAYRSIDEQNALYAKGRTAPGSIVTKAKGGSSFHNYGLAIDVVPIENGKINYKTTKWNEIAKIAQSIGFVWGYDWNGNGKVDKNDFDRPHFQMTFGKSLSEIQNLYAQKKVTNGYVNLG